MFDLRPARLFRRLRAALALLALAWLLAMPGWAMAAAQALAGPGADICRALSEPVQGAAPADHCTLCPAVGQAPALPVALAKLALPASGPDGLALPPALPRAPLLPWGSAQARAPPGVA